MKVSKRDILSILIILPFFVPETLVRVGDSEFIQNVVWMQMIGISNLTTWLFRVRNVIAIIIVLQWMVFACRSLKYTIANVYIAMIGTFLGYVLWLVGVTYVKRGNLYNTIRDMLVCVGFLCLMNVLLEKRGDHMLNILFRVLLALLVMNLLLGIVYPNGIVTSTDIFKTRYYLLGTKNQMTPILLSAIFLQLQNFKKVDVGFILEIAIIIANMIMVSSSTGTVAVAIMYGLWLADRNKKMKCTTSKNSKQKSITLFVGVLILSIGFVFLDFSKFFSVIFRILFSKDATLNSRTIIWEHAIEQIKSRPILGYGYGHTVFAHYYGHNLILELLLISGGIGLIIYMYMLTKICKDVLKGPINKISVSAIIVLVIVNTMEAFLFNVYQLCLLEVILYLTLQERKNKIKKNYFYKN